MTAVRCIIETQEQARTGTLGEALQAALAKEKIQKERIPKPLDLVNTKFAKREAGHKIVIDRAELRIELFAPQGYKMAYGTYATLNELVANVAHFIDKHKTTTVVYI